MKGWKHSNHHALLKQQQTQIGGARSSNTMSKNVKISCKNSANDGTEKVYIMYIPITKVPTDTGNSWHKGTCMTAIQPTQQQHPASCSTSNASTAAVATPETTR
jgi:hypothetical protein